MGVHIERYRGELRQTAFPPLTRETLADARIGFDYMLASSYPPRDIGPIIDRRITTHGRQIALRIYSRHTAPGPAILFFHGGGFVLGSLGSHDGFCRHLAGVTGYVVVSVDYSLAPESPYPAAVEDAVAAARWLFDECSALNIHRTRIAVMGDSAGGYLATKVAAAFPEFAVQVLLYPAVDFTAGTASHRAFGAGYGLDSQVIAFCYQCFLGGTPPAVASVLPGLGTASQAAPAIVIVAEADPLRDEAIAYANVLNRSGRGAALWDIADTVHGFAARPSQFPQAEFLLERLAHTLHRVFRLEKIDYGPIRAGG
jgi:acetyl esterase